MLHVDNMITRIVITIVTSNVIKQKFRVLQYEIQKVICLKYSYKIC